MTANKNELDTDVLLLAAGFGKRLLPLTEKVPKPLIQISGKALIDFNLDLLARSGARRVIVNLHYLPDAIRKHIGDGSRWGMEIEYSFEPQILDTGGAIKNIEPMLSHSTLLVMNSDTLFGPNLNLDSVLRRHRELNPEITVLLREDADFMKYGDVWVDSSGFVRKFLGVQYGGAGNDSLQPFMFAGLQVVSREVLAQMPPKGTVFSSTRDTWVNILQSGGKIGSGIFSGFWSDVGTPDRLAAASKEAPSIFGLP